MFHRNSIYIGDALKVLKTFPDECIDCVICSPPYYNLRFYEDAYTIIGGNKNCNHEWIEHKIIKRQLSKPPEPNQRARKKEASDNIGRTSNILKGSHFICKKCGAEKFQLGLEKSLESYIKHLADIFDEVKRVLKKTGTCWIIIGDSYAGNKYLSNSYNIKDGDLMLVPYRLAIELQNRGWYIKSMITWAKKVLFFDNETKSWDTKGNGLPESQKIRPVNNSEIIIMATKTKSGYYFDYNALQLGYKESTWQRLSGNFTSNKYKEMKASAFSLLRYGELYIKKLYEIEQQNSQRKKEYNGKYADPFLSETVSSIRARETRKHSNRKGLHRNLVEEKKKKGINPIEVALFLKKKIKEKGIEEEFYNFFGDKAHHWTRTDISGNLLPTTGEWFAIKDFLNLEKTPFDDFFINKIKKIDPGFKRVPNVWLINTESSSIPHFAIAPSKLVYLCLIHGCPKFVCKKCGKPYRKVWELSNKKREIDLSFYGADKEGKYKGEGKKEYEKSGQQNPSEIKKRILEKIKNLQQVLSFSYKPDCNCEEQRERGIVLDPFAGAGTTLIEAFKNGYDFIGIDISEKYCLLIKERLDKMFPLMRKNFKIINMKKKDEITSFS